MIQRLVQIFLTLKLRMGDGEPSLDSCPDADFGLFLEMEPVDRRPVEVGYFYRQVPDRNSPLTKLSDMRLRGIASLASKTTTWQHLDLTNPAHLERGDRLVALSDPTLLWSPSLEEQIELMELGMKVFGDPLLN